MNKTLRNGLLVSLAAVIIGFVVYFLFYHANLDDTKVAYVLTGGVTTNSAVVAFKTFKAAKVRVELSTDAVAYTGARYSDYVQTSESERNLGKIYLDSLSPDTRYYYRLEVNDSVGMFDGYSGTFRTHQEGAFSYKLAFGACAETGSESSIFTQIESENPLFYMNIGDLHYGNIDDDCRENFAEHYYEVFTAEPQAKLYRNTAFVYMWDDHDYGDNNSGIRADCREVALDSYKKFIPHYDLAFQQEVAPISQTFTVGRVRFLLTDLRSFKIEPEYLGCERTDRGTNFGTTEHLRWFKQQMLDAKAAGQMVVWISGIPFINGENGPNYVCDEDDDWGGFPEERAEISTFVEEHDIPMCILAGDAHMVAIDDGSNSDYGQLEGKGMPVFQAAPLDRYGSYKGGPYSHGFSAESGQYGLMEIEDNGGDEICVLWTAKDKAGNLVTNSAGEDITFRFCEKVGAERTPGNAGVLGSIKVLF
jgi:alkaline phosphatase D